MSPKNNSNDDVFSTTRMSLGEHLDELRGCLIKSLYGIAVAFVICLFFGNKIFSFLAQPLLLALQTSNLDRQLYATSLPEYFIAWIKVAFYSSLFLSAPWVFHHIWNFIAAGLYPKEKRFVHSFVPFSAFLFILGGAFFVVVVAPIAFNFFIAFASNMKTPEVYDNPLNRLIMRMYEKNNAGSSDRSTDQTDAALETNPAEENITDKEEEEEAKPLIKLIPKVDQYVSLVIVLALAFSIAFQMPLVVFLLGKVGLVRVETFGKVRKFVLLGIVTFSAIMTPPDPVSQILLSIPMYLLYEVGILLLRIKPRKHSVPRDRE